MNINIIIERYNLPTLEETLAGLTLNEQKIGIIQWYELILQATDHIPNKMVESFFFNLSQVTTEEFPMKAIGCIQGLTQEYYNVLEVRQYCREKINELRGVV